MSLNNLSIRLQVLIPLLLASLLMLLMAVVSKQEIDGAIRDMNNTTTSVTPSSGWRTMLWALP